MKWYIKRFNELTLEELYEIIKLRVNVFVVEQDCPYPECDDKDYNSTHIFAKDENSIAAYARALPPGISYDEASIGRVIVHNDYRGQKLGVDLMKRSIEYIELELKESSIRISAQEHLTNFYSSVGFRTVSETYLEDGIPHVEMLREGEGL